jgi:hypothetical protein
VSVINLESLAILGVGLVLVLLLVVLALLHRRRLNQISDRLAEGAVDNGETLKDVVERENAATRKHVSHAVDGIRNDTKFTKHRITDLADRQSADGNETRGQIGALRERLRTVVSVTDTLLTRIAEIPAQVGEWLTKNHPPPPP